jgi:hypothetical protein
MIIAQDNRCASPIERRLAWGVLMARRGHTINHGRLALMQMEKT